MSAAVAAVPRREARRVFVTSKFTTHFRHLLPVYKGHFEKKAAFEKVPTPAATKDRIKWWNIIPGDQVRIMAEKEPRIRQVKGINKITNRVFIEGDNKRQPFPDDDIRSITQQRNPNKNVHYSGLQLYLGHYDFPPIPGSDKPRNLPVFALRMGSTEPRWSNGRWVWDRFATATTPRLPTWRMGIQERIPIPWPEPDKPTVTDPTKYDTSKNVVAEVTYIPSPIPTRPKTDVPQLAETTADDYVRMIRHEMPYTQDYPAELFVARELSNPHSRIKKQQRYLAARARQRALLKTYVETELKTTIAGRSKREAIAEATFKWQQRVRLDRKAELKRRWVARGLKARLERRKQRTKDKLEVERKKLSDLVLREAPNQIMPKLKS